MAAHARPDGVPADSIEKNGIYRTPGRATETAPAPRPSWRLLVLPLWRATKVVLLITVPLALFSGAAVLVLGTSGELRLVPTIDIAQDILALSLLASLVVLVHTIVRRVVPAWRGLRLWEKVGYLGLVMSAQLAVVAAGETTILFSRGGIKLFEPRLRRSAVAPDGRTAHVYEGGLLSCRHEVYVAAPFSPTMKKELVISGGSCSGPAPRVRWNDDGSIDLVDENGAQIEPGSSGGGFFWGHGC